MSRKDPAKQYHSYEVITRIDASGRKLGDDEIVGVCLDSERSQRAVAQVHLEHIAVHHVSTRDVDQLLILVDKDVQDFELCNRERGRAEQKS